MNKFMAIRRNRIDYTVFSPNSVPDAPGSLCWDVRTATKARLVAKRLGIGSRIWRNINRKDKDKPIADFYQQSVFEWTGTLFLDITNNPLKETP
jgi:hypothetical protein